MSECGVVSKRVGGWGLMRKLVVCVVGRGDGFVAGVGSGLWPVDIVRRRVEGCEAQEPVAPGV